MPNFEVEVYFVGSPVWNPVPCTFTGRQPMEPCRGQRAPNPKKKQATSESGRLLEGRTGSFHRYDKGQVVSCLELQIHSVEPSPLHLSAFMQWSSKSLGLRRRGLISSPTEILPAHVIGGRTSPSPVSIQSLLSSAPALLCRTRFLAFPYCCWRARLGEAPSSPRCHLTCRCSPARVLRV